MQRTRQKVRPKTQKQLQDLARKKSQLLEECSIHDRKLSDFYHKAEKINKFNMYQGYLLMKELYGILIERRKVKNELWAITNEKHKVIDKEKLRKFTY
jgi:hypothetical protein